MFAPLKYLSCFFFPVCVVLFLYTGPHTVLTALLWTTPLWLIIAIDFLSPKIDPNKKKQVVNLWFYNTILYSLALLHFLIISLLLIYASQLQWESIDEVVTSFMNLIVMRILVGSTSGSSAIIVAHELIHRYSLFQRVLGRLILYTVCYEHFVIAHIRGHHLTVATPEDIATARLGESFETYWKRIYVAHFKYAWHFEQERLKLKNHPAYHYKTLANSVFQGIIVEITLVVTILFVFGWAAALIFLYQALSGVRLLETINYYQHWGLEQGMDKNTLAWINQSSFTEYALVGLSNHMAHHENATIPFQQIPYSEQGPKMPYGYFVTNLWVKLHNKSYRHVSEQVLKNYFKT